MIGEEFVQSFFAICGRVGFKTFLLQSVFQSFDNQRLGVTVVLFLIILGIYTS